MARAKAKRRASRPTPAVPGGRAAEWVVEADPEGRPVGHLRTVDTLGRLWRRGVIDAAMHTAGQAFAVHFYQAGLSGLPSPALDRVPGPASAAPLSERCVAARTEVAAALGAVGGANSPGGSALWHVVGLGLSLHAWAAQRGWQGRPLNPHEARGILVTALATLAAWRDRGP